MNHPKFSKSAHPGKEEFKRRVEWGLVAQNKVRQDLLDRGIDILNEDFATFQEHMPRVEIPEPDIECKYTYVEVRRQGFYEEVLLGYTKKLDGWMHHSELKGKELLFVMLDKSMDNIAWVSLTRHADKVYSKQNSDGDDDYALPLYLFTQHKYDKGMNILAVLI